MSSQPLTPAYQYASQMTAQLDQNLFLAGGGDVTTGSVGGLSPEAMIAFVEMNLSQTDSQIQTLMSQTTDSKDEIAALQQLSSDIRAMKGENRDNQKPYILQIQKDAAALGLDVKQTSSDPCTWTVTAGNNAVADAQQVMTPLQHVLNGWDDHSKSRGGDGKAISDNGLEAQASALDTISNNLSSGNEIAMIKLQSLVQERTRVIQFASNVMNTMNDAMKTEVNNIR